MFHFKEVFSNGLGPQKCLIVIKVGVDLNVHLYSSSLNRCMLVGSFINS